MFLLASILTLKKKKPISDKISSQLLLKLNNKKVHLKIKQVHFSCEQLIMKD